MRANLFASLTWLLLPAFLAVIPVHTAFGAVLTWHQLSDREELTFRFDATPPPAEPRQRGLTKLVMPIPWSYWKTEAKPDIPNLAKSKLIKDVSITEDGILIQTRTEDFIYSSSSGPDPREVTLEFYPPAKPASPELQERELRPISANGTVGNLTDTLPGDAGTEPEGHSHDDANASSSPGNTTEPETLPQAENNGTGENATKPLPEAVKEQPLPAAEAFRSKITRPGQDGEIPKDALANTAPFQLLRPIDRSAAPPGDTEAGHGNGSVTTPEMHSAAATHGQENASSQLAPAMPEEHPAPGAAEHARQEETAQSGEPSSHDAGHAAAPSEGQTQTSAAGHQPVEQPHNASPEAQPPQPLQTAATEHEAPTRAHETKQEEAPAPDGHAAAQADQHAEQNESQAAAAPQEHEADQAAREAAGGHGAAEPASTGHGGAAPEHAAAPQGHGEAAGNATADNSTAELEAMYQTAQTALATGDLKTGRETIQAMIAHPNVPEPLREELLYSKALIALQEGSGDLEGNFTTIRDAYQAALYSNLQSKNVPEALLNLGYLQLSVGNVPEAKAYFDLLRRKYPDNPRVAMIDYYWGEHYMKRKDYARAAEHFQYVIQNFPMSPAVKPATVGLLKAFSELGYFDKAMEIVSGIEKRWPRYYLEDPSFLMAAGYAAMLSGKLDQALEYFWGYANIVPNAPDADVAMARIGDIHLKQDKPNAAREVYLRTAAAYPDREGGLIAQMRLAEEGVLDKPSIGDMAPVFNRPATNPEEIYQRILEHTDSPLAPVARLKLAMWRLWNKQFAGCLDDVRQFEADYPGHDLLPKAREVADKALQDWIQNSLEQEDYEGVVKHWTDYESLYADRELPPRLRLVVATGFMRTGQTAKALEMARPFVFGSIPKGEFSEPGMDLTLSSLVDLQQWRDILELKRLVTPWKLGQDRQRQVDYAAALAYEKLDQPDKGKPLWMKLATDMALTDTQRGYAHYFLGRTALSEGNFEQADILAQEARNLLNKDKADIPKLKETLELLTQIADRRGRTQDALGWSLEYDGYVSEGDRDWAGHTYRQAILFRKNGETKKWRDALEKLKERMPDSLYGRMAAAEMEGARIEREVGKFQ